MTLHNSKNRWNQFGTERADLPSARPTVEEGSCLVAKMEDGKRVVDLSAGTSGEVYAGIALNGPRNVSEAMAFELITVPASPYKVTLAGTPKGTPTVRFAADNAAIAVSTSADPDATAKVRLTGRELLFNSADAGKQVRVFYKRDLTVTESQALFGEIAGAGPAGLGVTGVITKGEKIFVTNFDPASDWYTKVGPVYTGADGNFTLNSGGGTCDGVTVFQAPTPDFPFLGLNLR